jgi:hypothetical protein
MKQDTRDERCPTGPSKMGQLRTNTSTLETETYHSTCPGSSASVSFASTCGGALAKRRNGTN